MKPPKPNNSPGPGPEVVDRQRVVNKRAAQRVRSWTVEYEMGRMAAGAARKILTAANSRDKSLTEGYVHCSEDERAHNECDKKALVL